MKHLKMNAIEFEGCAVTVTLEGGIEKYAKSFLHIFNNVRESKELYKIENNYNNDVTVYCKPEVKENLIEYLENFGEIKKTERVLMYQFAEYLEYDYEKYYDQVVMPYFE